MSSDFKKFDTDKLRWDKFCWLAAECALKIFHFGAKKYDWDNWRKARGEDNQRMLAACLRHLIKHLRGEVLDQESGHPHLWHAYCTLGMHIENRETEMEAPQSGAMEEAKDQGGPMFGRVPGDFSYPYAWVTCPTCYMWYPPSRPHTCPGWEVSIVP